MGMGGCRKYHWGEITTEMTGAIIVSISFYLFFTGLHVTKHTHIQMVVFQPGSEARGELESVLYVLVLIHKVQDWW